MTSPDGTRRLVRIGELSAILGVPQWTLRRYANAGQIPVVRNDGQQRRFDPVQVKAALVRMSEKRVESDVDRAGANPAPASAPSDELVAYRDIAARPIEPSTPATWAASYGLAGLEEHLVWRDVVRGVGLDRDAPASRLMEYSLEEMVNNAVDHSGGTSVTVRVWSTAQLLAFRVEDDGEGAFAHLRRGLGLDDDFEAIAALTKGRQTTWRERHTGEGIFFTSKLNDIFKMTANGKTWTVDNLREDQSVGLADETAGTAVYAQVDPHTTKTSGEVFAEFVDDEYAFTRTRPSVKLASLGLRFASRSEARRLMAGLDDFSDIDVDFGGVAEMGQGFIDEMFRVWAGQHPDKTLTPINMNEAVEFMVRRGLRRS